MKAGKQHRIPLSARAIELLQSLPRESEFVFMGSKAVNGRTRYAEGRRADVSIRRMARLLVTGRHCH